jgi:hypothetical protein
MGHVLHVLSADALSYRQIVVTISGTSPVLSVTYPKVTLSRSWNSPRRQALAPEPHMLWKVGGTQCPPAATNSNLRSTSHNAASARSARRGHPAIGCSARLLDQGSNLRTFW